MGFDQLKAHVKDFTPEWAYGITTIKPDLIRKTAKEMADASPAVIVHPGRHVTWYGDDTQRIRAIAILNALLGSGADEEDFTDRQGLTPASPDMPAFRNRQKAGQMLFPGNIPVASSPVANVLIDASIPENNPGLLRSKDGL